MGKCEGFVSGFGGFRGVPATGAPFEFEDEVRFWGPSLGPDFPDIALEMDTVRVRIHTMLHGGGYTYFLACACSSLSNLTTRRFIQPHLLAKVYEAYQTLKMPRGYARLKWGRFN